MNSPSTVSFSTWATNRITAAFARMEAQVKDRIAKGLTTQAKVDEANKVLDISILEFVRFQEMKSLAVASGKLTLEEGMTVYNALGNTPIHFNSQPAHVKSVLTNLLSELFLWHLNKAA